jgi:hypothetical protein
VVAVADPKQAAAAHDAKDWKRCAELWLAVAATTKGEATAPPLYDAACCQAMGGDLDAAFTTLERAVTAGLQEPGIVNDPDLAPLRADARWPKLVAEVEQLREKRLAAIGDPALRETLLALDAELDASGGSSRSALAERNTTGVMKTIIAQHGWPGRTLVGRDGAHAAWAIVQASSDLAFQKQCLERLEIAVAQGEAQAIEHAYLYDRIAATSDKPQRWGTQLRDDGTPYPIEDEAHVDDRRKAIGLPTMAEYQKLLRERGR